MRKIAMIEKKKTISKENAAENIKAFRRELRDRGTGGYGSAGR